MKKYNHARADAFINNEIDSYTVSDPEMEFDREYTVERLVIVLNDVRKEALQDAVKVCHEMSIPEGDDYDVRTDTCYKAMRCAEAIQNLIEKEETK